MAALICQKTMQLPDNENNNVPKHRQLSHLSDILFFFFLSVTETDILKK